MLSTKSLGKLNSLFTQEELQYNMPNIEIPSDAYYSEVTDGYLYYSDFRKGGSLCLIPRV